MLCPFALTSAAVQAYSGTKAVCSGNGRCLTLREVNEYGDAVSFGAGVHYDNWDADMIHGCVCDDGWEGPACERRSCPKGDDPLTAAQDDVQLLDCQCSTCQGGVYLSFLGQQTALIPFDASEQLIAYRLGVSWYVDFYIHSDSLFAATVNSKSSGCTISPGSYYVQRLGLNSRGNIALSCCLSRN